MEIAIVIPTYNSSSVLEKLIDQLNTVIAPRFDQYQIIIVNDYSNDNTWETIQQIKAKFPSIITGINLSRNYGQHNATLCGIVQSSAKYVVTIDDDLEYDPSDILKLYQKIESSMVDIVYGVPMRKSYNFFRALFSSLFSKVQKLEGPQKGKGSSFRIINNNLAKKIKRTNHNFVFIDELCLWYTDKIDYVDINKRSSSKNGSSYSLSKLISLSLNLILYSSRLPLRVMTYFGLSASVLTVTYGILLILRKLLWGNSISGYTSLMVAILFTGSVIMFCLGIIGEYLNKIYKTLNKMPTYSIDEII